MKVQLDMQTKQGYFNNIVSTFKINTGTFLCNMNSFTFILLLDHKDVENIVIALNTSCLPGL